MKHPRVLIISHNCLSDSGSNGRTLANFLKEYPQERLAQFYIYNEKPTCTVCRKYYRVTDREAVKSLLKKNCGGQIQLNLSMEKNVPGGTDRKPKRTPFVYFAREMVWRLGHWRNKQLWSWIDAFSPEVVLFQAGDGAFLFDFARKISQKRNIPLVIYNSESYYFKEQNFLAQSRFSDLWYKILHSYFQKHAGKAIRHAKKSIYISDILRQRYDEEFQTPSVTVMTSTDLLGTAEAEKTEDTTITYLGNLGVGRHETLIELAGILQSIDPSLELRVYGKANPEMEARFAQTAGIRYGGFVSYEDCVRIMKESTVLVHTENFSEFYLEDSKYAFSTKIADCLASGTCLFVYAPEQMAFARYLVEKGAACVASTPSQAKEELTALLRSEALRKQYAQRAMETAVANHSIDSNRKKFLEALF